MKKYLLIFIISITVIACNESGKAQKTTIDLEKYSSYGGKMDQHEVSTVVTMQKKYATLQKGDSLAITFSGAVDKVCKAKGCWMTIPLDKEQEIMVKFKDYGFFVPTDIEKDSVIVQGKAFVNEMSVEEQRHYAMDAGKPQEEIEKITTPKRTYSFVANSVLIQN